KCLGKFEQALIPRSYSNLWSIEPTGPACMEIKAIICMGQNFLCKMIGYPAGKRTRFCAWENPVQIPTIGKRTISIQKPKYIQNRNTNNGASTRFVQFASNKLPHYFHPINLVAMDSSRNQNRRARNLGSLNDNGDFNL